MNNKTLGVVVGVVVIAAVAFFLTRHKTATETQVAATNSSVATKSQATMEQKSLKALLADGGSRKCTYSSADAAGTGTGTVYVSDGKFRGDFSATASNKTMMSHMVSDGQQSYVWMDGTANGFKMKFDDSMKPAPNGQTQSMDPNKNYDFSCSSWLADGSLFVTPTNVQFTDMSTMMTPPSPGTGMSASACDKLPEPAKSQCKAAMPK